MNKKQFTFIISVYLLVLWGKIEAFKITITSYNHSNIIVEMKDYTSNVSDKVIIDNIDHELTGVKIFEVSEGKKELLFMGDVHVKRNQSAEAIAFPYNLLLIKELSLDTGVSPALKSVDLQDVNNILLKLKSKRNETKRLDVYKEVLKQYSFTSSQLAVILSGFTFEEIKAHAAIMSYDNVIDKKNFIHLYYLLMNSAPINKIN